ncbi:MAG: glycosyltransferase family 4 protein [Patescibacteria group bacterium]
MKLLIITQAVDRNHPILGFFHRWIEEFAKHAEHIHVIALQVGEYNLPKNVTVHSLGKIKNQKSNIKDKIRFIFNFLHLTFILRKQYDSVFVHMNPEYIVLAGWVWRLTGKKIGLWYNHSVGSFWLRIAQPFTSVVFHTSPYAYTARYKNARRMPAGIDTTVFKPHPEIKKIPKSIYFQGRIAPAKRVHIILEAFAKLHALGEAKVLTLVGPEDEEYTKPLREKYASLIRSGAVVFKGSVPHSETPVLYAAHEVSVNLTDDGNYDKTVLESIACGIPCIVSSAAFGEIIEKKYILDQSNVASLETTLTKVVPVVVDAVSLHTLVIERESLALLSNKIFETYKSV